MDSRIAMGIIIGASVLGAVAQILFKQGTQPVQVIRLGLGFGLYGIAFIVYLVALRSLPLSVAYPLIALSYIWVALGSFLILGEQWSVSKSIGTLGLVVCVWLIAR